MSGPLLGFGCAVMLSTESSPWYQENAPGLIRSIGALLFPIGLVMIVLTGADLFTSNIMFLTIAFLHRRVSVWDVVRSWVVSFLGNLAGTLFFMGIIAGYGGIFQEDPYRQQSITMAVMKTQVPGWHQIFLRGIGANWLVCIAVFLSISARDIAGKIIAIWWPTATFEALGMDHVVANMFFIPMGIFNGAPISVGYYIWKSMVPTALGNMVGGGLLVGMVYWYLYLTGEGDVDVSFNTGGIESATEAGGPMGAKARAMMFDRQSKSQDLHQQSVQVISGLSSSMPTSESKIASPRMGGHVDSGTHLPHSGGLLLSSVGKELGEKFTKKKGTGQGDGPDNV